MCLSLYFTSQHLFVRRPIYLSEHILGNREVRAHIAHSAHILLIQFREIALSQKKKKKVVIILSLSVPGDIYSK